MIYDYKDNEGYVSIWIGECTDYETLGNYLSTIYIEDDCEMEKLNRIFLSGNENRPCERELREKFDEQYNQFEYDFGLSFDEDFREAVVLAEACQSIEELLSGFSAYDTFLDAVKYCMIDSFPNPLNQSYNAAVALYNFKYDGNVRKVVYEGLSLTFVGSFRFHW